MGNDNLKTDKNSFAVTPPMGWNSYDYYDTGVTEQQVKANADYMAEHLKEYGWEYVVVDIQWYSNDAGTKRSRYQYIPFGDVQMDGYGRWQRFPGIGGVHSREGAEIRHSYHAGDSEKGGRAPLSHMGNGSNGR